MFPPQFAPFLLTIFWHFIIPVTSMYVTVDDDVDLAQNEQSALLATAAGLHFKDLTKIVSNQDWNIQMDSVLNVELGGRSLIMYIIEEQREKNCPLWVVGEIVQSVVAGMKLNGGDWRQVDMVDFTCGEGDLQDDDVAWPNLQYFLKYYMKYTTDVMMYSPQSKVVIDLTGHGIEDTRAKILRPAMVANLNEALNETFKLWYGKQEDPLGDYNRMIHRGWEPYSPEFRKFMRNEWEEWSRSTSSTSTSTTSTSTSSSFRHLWGRHFWRRLIGAN